MIGMVTTFDDAENKAWLIVPESNLERYVDHDATLQFGKTKDFEAKNDQHRDRLPCGKVRGTSIGLEQVGQVSVAD